MSFSKRISIAFCVFTSLIATTPSMAQDAPLFQQKPFPIESVLGARWIDRANNTISLTFLSLYPSGCYSLDSSAGFTATVYKKIYISQTVNVSNGMCTMAIVSQTEDTAILVTEVGAYTVVDALTNKTLGTLIINDGELTDIY